MALAEILYSREYPINRGVPEYVGAAYQPSLNAFFAKLYRLSDVKPGVRSPVGGARTKAECNALGTSWTISDHWEGRGRAVDVDNRAAVTLGLAQKLGITFNQAVTLYYATAAEFGWHNITTDGYAFPTEPWHLANHSSTPAGSGGVPLPDAPAQATQQRKETDMQNFVDTSTYASGAATKDTIYATAGGSPGTPANFRKYARGAAMGNSSTDPAILAGQAHGPHVPVDHATFVALEAAYLAPVKIDGQIEVGDVTVPAADNTAIVAAIEALGASLLAKLDGLPVAIDDVTKQAGR